MSDDDGLLLGRIVIERRYDSNGTWDDVTTEDEFGEPMDLAAALGLLRIAEHRLTWEDEA